MFLKGDAFSLSIPQIWRLDFELQNKFENLSFRANIFSRYYYLIILLPLSVVVTVCVCDSDNKSVFLSLCLSFLSFSSENYQK